MPYRRCFVLCASIAVLLAAAAPDVRAADPHPLLDIVQSELDLSMERLETPDGARPYFIQYRVSDVHTTVVSATLGAVQSDDESHVRLLDVDLRVGDYELDNTRQIRGAPGFGAMGRFGGITFLPIDDDPMAIRHAIWLRTDNSFRDAVNRLAQVKANLKVKVEEEDPSDDFSREDPSVAIEPWLDQSIDRDTASERVKAWSKRFRDHPEIYNSSVSITGSVTNRVIVNTEGTRLLVGQGAWRIGIQASTIAEDGMELFQYASFDAHSPEGLPDDATVAAAVETLIGEVLALREAPIVEPFTGPAILMNRASGVFFHEIFGHRIEGHRQKDVNEGQTFAKKIGEQVLPPFLSLVDDPTRRTYGTVELNGYYPFDDEGIPAQPVRLVDSGVLETFLLSRSPTRGFTRSTGHGRAQPGLPVVARQGNLTVESTKQVPFEELREMLIETCREQGKDYGLLFKDISGGFTTTQRMGPQAFKVLPIIVYKVYADGRPDELVRGVDIVGTPLTCFSKIIATGDDPDVFNGMCGAESGMVPVSAISPSILVEQIEIEKKQKSQDRAPLLPAPIAVEGE